MTDTEYLAWIDFLVEKNVRVTCWRCGEKSKADCCRGALVRERHAYAQWYRRYEGWLHR